MLNIESTQELLCLWVIKKGSLSFQEIRNACNKIIEKQAIATHQEVNYSDSYKVVFPLLQTGVLEHGIDETGQVRIFYPAERGPLPLKVACHCRYEINGINYTIFKKKAEFLLKKMPSVGVYAESLPDYGAIKGRFYFDESSFSLKPSTSRVLFGLFKERDYPFFPYYLVMTNGKTKKVDYYENSVDCMLYSHCYSCLANYSIEKILKYDWKSRTLSINNPKVIPTLLMRALLLLDVRVFANDNVYVGNQFVLEDVSISDFDEIQRIMSI